MGGHDIVQWMQIKKSEKAGITCSLWRPNYSPGPAKRRSFWARHAQNDGCETRETIAPRALEHALTPKSKWLLQYTCDMF